jgi:hypothetical protein
MNSLLLVGINVVFAMILLPLTNAATTIQANAQQFTRDQLAQFLTCTIYYRTIHPCVVITVVVAPMTSWSGEVNVGSGSFSVGILASSYF